MGWFWWGLCRWYGLPDLSGQLYAAEQYGKDCQCKKDVIQQRAERTVQPVMVMPTRMMMTFHLVGRCFW